MTHNTILFGSFRLDTDPDRLWRGSEEVPLRAKSLSVLAYLARPPGRLVTKDELREQVWGATHVSDTTLRVTVREIRATLGDDTTGSSYLETVPGRGYRFHHALYRQGLYDEIPEARRARLHRRIGEHLRRILTPYDPLRLADVHTRYGQVDHALACLGVNAWRLWLQGYPDQALAQTREARKLAERLNAPYIDACAGYLALPTLQFCGDIAQLDRRARDMQRLCAEQGYALWLAWATCFEGWVAAARGDLSEGIAVMERGVDAFRGTGARVHLPHLLALLAELCLRAGHIEAASERLAEAHARAESGGERYWEAELHRLEGEILVAGAEVGGRDGDHGDRAEACFQGALEVARRQQARSLELRAALSLSHVWSRSRRDEARRVLGGVLETFSEGHDTADLRAAREQMAQL